VRALELSADGAVLLGRKSPGRGYARSSAYRAWSTTTWEELGAQPLSSSAMVPLSEGDFLVTSQNVYARWTPGEQPRWLPYATQPLPRGVEPTSVDGEVVQRGSGLGGIRYYRQGTLPQASGGSYGAPRTRITLAPDDVSLWVVRAGTATRVALDGGEVLETRTSEDVAIHHALLSPDGRFSAHRTGELVQIWEAESGRQVAEAPVRTRSLAWSTDGRSLLCHTAEGQDLLIWDVSSLYEGRAPAPLYLPGK
jgi:hypothetical protein